MSSNNDYNKIEEDNRRENAEYQRRKDAERAESDRKYNDCKKAEESRREAEQISRAYQESQRVINNGRQSLANSLNNSNKK